MAKDYQLSIISNERDNGRIEGAKIHECLSRDFPNKIVGIFYELYRAIRIRVMLDHIEPDIVHIHSFDYIHPFMIGLVSCFSKSFRNLVVSTWGTDVLSSFQPSATWVGNLSKRLLLYRADRITATTHFLSHATKQLSSAGKTVQVIPFGIDCDIFSRQTKKTSNNINIGFIKHLKPKYGPEYLIKAFALVEKEHPNIELTMVGKGEMRQPLERLARRLGVVNKVHFLGYLDYETVPDVLKEIDIFVMPSTEDSETFGVAAIEAQAMCIPVVASEVGGVPEALIDNITGMLVEPKNVEQLANSIARLIKNPELRIKMGIAGRKFVLENFNLHENVELFDKLYREILKE